MKKYFPSFKKKHFGFTACVAADTIERGLHTIREWFWVSMGDVRKWCCGVITAFAGL